MMGAALLDRDGLTRGQRKTLAAIRDIYIRTGRYPTYEELSGVRGRAKSQVRNESQALMTQGKVTMHNGKIVGVWFGERSEEAARRIAGDAARIICDGRDETMARRIMDEAVTRMAKKMKGAK